MIASLWAKMDFPHTKKMCYKLAAVLVHMSAAAYSLTLKMKAAQSS
jgi:hypothetical protein